ncbi:hypothetical protein SESBI_20863 [Sesbania bispinosa]|nr:hypothetical protein SESBI_20863 [Sesbania bispinosa]
MARRSPPVVNETGCTWRMFGIFNSRDGHSDRRLVSNRSHSRLLTHSTATGNGNSRSSSDVLSRIDEKYPHIGVSSRRRRNYGCKSISCVENDQVADWGNEVTKMIVDQRIFNKNYQGKDGAGYKPDQFLDALQVLYSNKELFVKLLQDPNSLLAKQIHELQSSQVTEPYQARQKRMNRLNKSQNSNARKSVKNFNSSDRYHSSCEPQSSERIVVLKPSTTSCDCPRPHSSSSFSHNAQNIKPSNFPFGRIKRKLRHVMSEMSKDQQQRRTAAGVPCEFPCGGKEVKELEIAGRNSPINRLKNSESCMGQEAASFGESCSNNTNNTSLSPSEQNTLNIHDEDNKSPSQMLNCEIEECKQCTNSLVRTIPLPDTERMIDHNNDQMVLRTKLGLQKDEKNYSFSSSGQKFKDPSVVTVNTLGDELQLFGADVSTRRSFPCDNLHAHYDIPTDCGYTNESPTQNFDITTGGLGSFLDSHQEIQTLSFSSDAASSCQRIEDEDDVTNPPIAIFQPDESPVQVKHEKFEENYFADLIRSSLDPINKLTSSKDMLDYFREIVQAFTLKWDELTMKSASSDLLMDSSTFDELKGLTGPKILHDCSIEIFMKVYQNCCFSPHPNVEAYVVKNVLAKEIAELVNLHFLPRPSPITLQQLVEKDLAKRGSWLNIQVDTEDIAIEMEKDILEKLVLEIASEMDHKALW